MNLAAFYQAFGRARKKASGPPLARLEKGVLFLGVVATPDGFEVRTFGTRPPARYPHQPAASAALAAYPDQDRAGRS